MGLMAYLWRWVLDRASSPRRYAAFMADQAYEGLLLLSVAPASARSLSTSQFW